MQQFKVHRLIALISLNFLLITTTNAAKLEASNVETQSARLIDRLPQEQTSAFYVNSKWQNHHGNKLHLHSFFNTDSVVASVLDSYKVSYSLNYPIKAIHTYLTPRLKYAIKRINYFTPSKGDQLPDIKAAFISKNETPNSKLFWQAYNQYQDDAFYHLKISPCVHPDSADLPCVRPNYSQLFYEYKPYVKTIAKQLHLPQDSSAKHSFVDAIENAQEWVQIMPDRDEEQDHFAPPISVLKSNLADSDEKALLLATLVSQVAPQYKLFMVYPSASIGSVSPVWLTIDSKSGMKGKQITINSNQYTVISGSDNQLEEMLSVNTRMTSESLY